MGPGFCKLMRLNVMKRSSVILLLFLFGGLSFAGCGSKDSKDPVIVKIRPSGGGPTGQSGFFLLPVGGEVAFKAEISGTLNQAVTWQPKRARGTTQVDPTDKNKVKYIAPTTFSFVNETDTIQAASVEDPGAFEDAFVQLTRFVESSGQTLALGEDEIIVGGLAVSPSRTIDFNGDQIIDMASRNSTDGTVTFNFGNPPGPNGELTFSGKNVLVTKPVSLVVGDFFNEQDPNPVLFRADTAVLSQNMPIGSGGKVIFISGDNEVNPAAVVPVINTTRLSISTGTPQLLASGRLHDPPSAGQFTPVSDLAVGTNEGKVIIFLQNRNPDTFSPIFFGSPKTVDIGGVPKQLLVGDFNGDGFEEIAIVREGDSNLIILRGDQGGDFSGPAITITFPAPIESLISADFSGDGISDLIAAHKMPNKLSVFLGNGTGGFTDVGMIPLTFTPGRMATGDLNLGGNIDVAVTDMDAKVIHIFFGDGTGQFIGEWQSQPALLPPRSLISGAFSGFPSTIGFQNADLIYINQSTNKLQFLNNKNFE